MVIDSLCVAVVPVGSERPDLVKERHERGLLRSGFDAKISFSKTGPIGAASRLRFFVVSQGGKVASELSYPPSYQFRH
jgi:hypothetical protein